MSLRNYAEDEPGGTGREPVGRIVVLAIIFVGLVATCLVLYCVGTSQASRAATDPETLCPTKLGIPVVTVVLLDMSDEFSEAQRLSIQNHLARLKNTLPRYALVEVYAVNEAAKRVAEPLLHMCNPGDGSDMNELYQNPEMAKKRWAGFADRLDSEMELLLKSPDSATSPILEAVQATALRTFNRPEYSDSAKALIIVSDLMQNVPGRLSMYHDTPVFEEFRHSSYFSEVRADLTNVDVTLLYLVRPTTPQAWPAHHRFWEQVLQAEGANVSTLEPIFGANLGGAAARR